MPNFACCFQPNLKEGAQMMAAFNCGFHLPLWICSVVFAGIFSDSDDDIYWCFILMLFGTLIVCVANGIIGFSLRSASFNAKINLGSLIAFGIGVLVFTIGYAIFFPFSLAGIVYLPFQGWIMFLVHGANQEIKNANNAAPSA